MDRDDRLGSSVAVSEIGNQDVKCHAIGRGEEGERVTHWRWYFHLSPPHHPPPLYFSLSHSVANGYYTDMQQHNITIFIETLLALFGLV